MTTTPHDNWTEGKPTADQVRHLIDQGLTPQDVAKLYRVRVDQVRELLAPPGGEDLIE